MKKFLRKFQDNLERKNSNKNYLKLQETLLDLLSLIKNSVFLSTSLNFHSEFSLSSLIFFFFSRLHFFSPRIFFKTTRRSLIHSATKTTERRWVSRVEWRKCFRERISILRERSRARNALSNSFQAFMLRFYVLFLYINSPRSSEFPSDDCRWCKSNSKIRETIFLLALTFSLVYNCFFPAFLRFTR